MSKAWRSLPLHTFIAETIKKTGLCTDEELLRDLQKVTSDVSPKMINKALLKLEMHGFIRVSNITKGRKKIELIKR
ncbi:MAG: hypothetical protein ABIH76_07025 [Candidatus Bathyarchaeota archaeon]